MSLLAYNLTIAPVALVGVTPVTTLPASSVVGKRGAAVNVTAELKNLTGPEFVALQNQANPAPGSPTSALVVQYVWSTGVQEFATPGLIVQASSDFVANEDFFLWAGPAGIAGAGGTPSNPTTIEDAFGRLPGQWKKQCKLFLLPGVYTGAFVPAATFDARVGTGIGSTSTPFTIIGDYSNEIGDRTSSAAASTSITDGTIAGLAPATTLSDNPLSATATTVNVASTTGFVAPGFIQIDSEIIMYSALTGTSFTGCTRGAGAGSATHTVGAAVTQVDKYRGYFISIIVAGAVQQRRMITTNTGAGQFVVNAAFSPVPVAGAIFRIEKPSAQIDLAASFVATGFGQSSLWGMKGIHWNAAAGGRNFANTDQSNLGIVSGCWFTGVSNTSRLTLTNTRMSEIIVAGVTGALADAWSTDPVNPFSATTFSAGIYFRYAAPQVNDGSIYGASLGYTMLDESAFLCAGGNTLFDAPHARFGSYRGLRGSVMQSFASSTIASVFDGSPTGTSSAQKDLLFLQTSAICADFLGLVTMKNSLGSAVRARNGSILNALGSNSAGQPISGSNNAAYGLHIEFGAQVVCNNPGLAISGLLGEVKIGDRPVQTWAAFKASHPSTVTGTGDTIGGAAPNMTLLDAGGRFMPSDVGKRITIAGATTPANNGTFPITAVADQKNLTYTNAAGVAEAYAGAYTLVDRINNVLVDSTPYAPNKVVLAALVGADSHSLVANGMPPALIVGSLRVTGAAGGFTGDYLVSDSGATMAAPAAGVPGVARLSDDGITLTFPVGATVTDFVINYIPAEAKSVTASTLINTST